MATVLVTGGAGYIGSHACKALKRAGHIAVTYDNLSRGHQHAVKFGPFEEGDILDKNRLTQVIDQYQPDAVMHFAAVAMVPESVENPALYYHNNVVGTLSLLEAMRERQLHNIIFSSTCAVYGEVTTMPVTEDTPTAPTNAYGGSKKMVEDTLQDYARAYNLRPVILRYFNAAGSDIEAEIGDERVPVNAVIPLAVLTAAGERECFNICGTDYNTPDGTGVRDYIHVDDLVAAHVKALDYLLAGGEANLFNLGTEQPISVKQIVSAIEATSGKPLPVQHAPRRAGDLGQIYADASKARTILGWQPNITDINEMVASSWKFHNRQK